MYIKQLQPTRLAHSCFSHLFNAAATQYNTHPHAATPHTHAATTHAHVELVARTLDRFTTRGHGAAAVAAVWEWWVHGGQGGAAVGGGHGGAGVSEHVGQDTAGVNIMQRGVLVGWVLRGVGSQGGLERVVWLLLRCLDGAQDKVGGMMCVVMCVVMCVQVWRVFETIYCSCSVIIMHPLQQQLTPSSCVLFNNNIHHHHASSSTTIYIIIIIHHYQYVYMTITLNTQHDHHS